MTVRLRLAGVAVGLLVCALVLARWTFAVLAEGPTEVSISLPHQLGPWVLASEEELEDWVLEMIQPDAYVMRWYEHGQVPPVSIYVGLYARWSGFGRRPHSPEGCYPAGGWEIVAEQAVDVPMAGGGTLRAKLLGVQQAGREEVVVYWSQPPERWPGGGALEQLRRAFDSMRGRPQFAFVRLSAPAAATGDVATLLEFAGHVAGPIRAAVEGLGAADGPRAPTARGESPRLARGGG